MNSWFTKMSINIVPLTGNAFQLNCGLVCRSGSLNFNIGFMDIDHFDNFIVSLFFYFQLINWGKLCIWISEYPDNLLEHFQVHFQTKKKFFEKEIYFNRKWICLRALGFMHKISLLAVLSRFKKKWLSNCEVTYIDIGTFVLTHAS